MDGLTTSMLVAAVGVALVHTALGPDHYLPFVMLSRARGWSLSKTLWITGLCGVGHVASSLLLGALGIAAGVALGAIESVEARRGAIAAWALFGVGVAYGLWGLRRALQKRRGVALHEHGGEYHLHGGGGEVHAHAEEHHHHHGHSHAVSGNTTFWALFIVFVLGPCEPLIPLFMVPACQERWGAAIATAAVFALVTIATMLTITTIAVLGISHLPLQLLERWTHAMAGAVIAASAAMVLFLGL